MSYQRLAYVQTLTSNYILIAVTICKVTHRFFYAIVLRVKVYITYPLQKNSKITLTSHQSPWQITRLGGTYQMSYGKLSLRWLSSLLSMNGHITFAVNLILCITHVIVLQHWLRFIFKAFHKFTLAFPMFSWRKRKAKSLLVF